MGKLIEQRFIYHTFPAAPPTVNSSFDFIINNMPFEPDYMIIKSLAYKNDGVLNTLTYMRSNLTNKYLPMFGIETNAYANIYSLNLRFPLNKSIDGVYTFDFIDIINGGPTEFDDFYLTMNIEFVKEI